MGVGGKDAGGVASRKKSMIPERGPTSGGGGAIFSGPFRGREFFVSGGKRLAG